MEMNLLIPYQDWPIFALATLKWWRWSFDQEYKLQYFFKPPLQTPWYIPVDNVTILVY